MAGERKLSKKEKKAEAFKKRAKKSQTQFTEEMAVPQADEIVEESPAVKEESKPESKSESKPTKDLKRKAEPISVPSEGSEKPEKRARRDANANRYIVFVGNLPYTTTKEDLENHFESAGEIKSIRLLTDKATGKPKGFAFMEFGNSKDLNKALAFHHTFFKKRQINVELTAGGGGSKSDARKEKLKKKNERLAEERVKKHEKIKKGNFDESESSYQLDTPQQ
ncbi:MAG: hypothetical protein EXX96DRAFT_617784 [Benjaminiella poitrasii]|nr:MAG: hypothetical protein EXX96DRAFT_617784 [Benjaminiella poitrasii]